MSIQYPTNLDNLQNPLATDNTVTVSHAGQHSDENDAIEAIETKLGIDNSTVTSTIDYKLKNSASINPGHKHSLLAGISDVAITSPTTGNGLFYNETSGKWENANTSVADASTTVKGVTKLSTTPTSPTNPIAVGDNDTRMPTQSENDALVGTSGTPSSTNKYVTQDDVTIAKTASKIVRRDANGDVLVTTIPTSGDGATSKTYVDAKKNGYLTIPAVTGIQNIAHGLGRIPTKIKITTPIHSVTRGADFQAPIYSVGVYNGITTTTLFTEVGRTDTTWYTTNDISTTKIIRLHYWDTYYSEDTLGESTVTFDSTNIILNWSSVGYNGTKCLWEAE